MRIHAVNVGRPRSVPGPDGVVVTGIYKTPVVGRRVPVRSLNLDGDGQADPRVHGGLHKAVYVYSADHYAYWRRELGRDLEWGEFGENLDVDGCGEDEMSIGDTLRAGTALLQVTGPRLPCSKLALRFGDPGMIRRFLHSGRTGFYTRVLEEGDVGAGDALVIASRDPLAVPVSEITRLHTRDRHDVEAMQRALRVEALDPSWRRSFGARLEGAE